MKERKKMGLIASLVFFVVYFFAAARPVPLETVLIPRWLSSLESGNPVAIGDASLKAADSGEADAQSLLPFKLGSRFGYVDANGRFSINQIKKGEVSLSREKWAEYEATPLRVEVRDTSGNAALAIENPNGYPFFLDDRIFIIGNEQNALTALDATGESLWRYEFAAPLTCVDAAAGLVLTGALDGVAELLDGEGNRLFYFEPGGSRYSVILGCALSRDGSRLGLISGIDDQRFLLLERFGSGAGEYKVIYHEFLEDGFRRPVQIAFIEQDQWVIFEREGGIGVYEIHSRQGKKVALAGEVIALDQTGGQGLFFVITAHPEGYSELAGVRLPDRILMNMPFKSADVFLGRTGQRLVAGGGQILASFELEKQ